MKVKKTKILYRYYGEVDISNKNKIRKNKYFNRLEDLKNLFENSNIHLSKPSSFNDPFDSRGFNYSFKKVSDDMDHPFTKKLLEDMAKKGISMSDKTFKERYKFYCDYLSTLPFNTEHYQELLMDTFRILCFSEKNDNILMWSHYSSGHLGFCLEFNVTYSKSELGPAYKVRYPSDNKFMTFDFGYKQPKLFKQVFLRKAKNWKYEKEWRMFWDYESDRKEDQNFPPSSLTGVIFGFLMPDEDKQALINWIKSGKSNPRLYQATRSNNEFKIIINKI